MHGRKFLKNINDLIADLSDEEMAVLPGSEGLSLKEVVHHLVEANIVASSMIIAALGASGCKFDWSWLYPNKEWTERLGYSKVRLSPSIETLKSLITHLSNIVAAGDGTLTREIRLFDSPGAETYTMTVSQLIRQEVDHAALHLADVRKASAWTSMSKSDKVHVLKFS